MGFRRLAVVSASVLALGALGVGAASAVAQQGSSSATTSTSTAKTTTPMQTTVTSKVTKVSASAHYFVESGKTIYVTQKTSFHLVRGGLGGIKTNRRYKVVVTDVNGKYTAVSVTRV